MALVNHILKWPILIVRFKA